MIIGCDLHTRYQQIAMVDTETGEFVERRLEHERRVPHPSFFDGWDSTVVARVGFLADSSSASFNEHSDDPSTHPFRKVREKNGAPGTMSVGALAYLNFRLPSVSRDGSENKAWLELIWSAECLHRQSKCRRFQGQRRFNEAEHRLLQL